MADIPAPKKRGRPAMVPLATGADTSFVSPAPIVSEPAPEAALPVIVAPAPAEIVAPEPTPIAAEAAPVVETEPAPIAPAAAPVVAPEPSVTPAVTMEPAPVDTVATPPSPPAEPVSIAVTHPEAPTEPTSKGFFKMATAFPTAPAETAEKAKAMFGDMNARAKTAMEKSAKLGEEMTELTKGNVEALVQSSRLAAKGAETLAQDVAETMKKHFESTTATMKSFASVKSPTELFQLQSDAAKSYFDSAVADMSKFTEQLMKLAGEVAQPLSNRYSVAMEKVKASAL